MTTIHFVTVAKSIANINYSEKGIHSKSFSDIPISAVTECPMFTPQPDTPVTDLLFTRESFGSGGTEKMNLQYVMNYRYYHAPIGAILSFDDYQIMIENIEYILEQIADNDAPAGAVDLKILNIPAITKVADAAGALFHGVDISLQVLEFING